MDGIHKTFWRTLTLVLVVVFFFSVYAIKLVSMQLINGDSYLQQAHKISERIQAVPAARGEITDRYGKPLAGNRMTYSIVFDRAFLNESVQNPVILALFPILEKAGEEWTDTLPILQTENECTFIESMEKEIAKLKKYLRLNDYATAENCMTALVKKFDLKSLDKIEARRLSGVLYQMELDYFTISTPYTFARDVSPNTVAQIKERSAEYPGVDAITSPIREYLSGKTAPHLMGSVGPIYQENYEALKDKGYKMNDLTGNGGLEEAMEDFLRGHDGERTIEQDTFGSVIDAKETKAPVPGNTVVLTIDKRLQDIAQKSLENAVRTISATAKADEGADANAGAVSVVDVTNGEILTLATYPSYDLATYKQEVNALIKDTQNRPLINRPLLGTYEPGSVMKPAIALAGLEDGTLAPNTSFNCTTSYTYFADRGDLTYIPKCLNHSDHTYIGIVRAITVSCNIFFYETGRRLGIEKMNNFCAKLGLGTKTGIEVPESGGILAGPGRGSRKEKGSWLEGDTVQAAIGQSDNTFTPLQMAIYCSTIANGGTRYKAHLVKEIKSYDLATTIKSDKPEVVDTLSISSSTESIIREAMRAVCTDGTAKEVFSSYRMKVAGKTGTAEVPTGSPNATFICFAPFDKPKIAISIVVEHGGHGSTIASVARDIIEGYFYYEPSEKSPTPENKLLG